MYPRTDAKLSDETEQISASSEDLVTDRDVLWVCNLKTDNWAGSGPYLLPTRHSLH